MDYKKILISTGLLTIIVWVFFFVLGMAFKWFGPWCIESGCPGKASIFFAYSFVLLPLWMLVVFGGLFLIEFFNKK